MFYTHLLPSFPDWCSTQPEQYNATTFNAFIYLTSLKAGIELATAVGDNATVALAQAAYTDGVAAVMSTLWNAKGGYFQGFTGVPTAIHADCLYGQVLSLYMGLGWHVPQAMIASHLASELKTNGNPYGLQVVTGRPTATPQPLPEGSAAVSVIGGGDQLSPRQRAVTKGRRHLTSRNATQLLGGRNLDTTNWMGAGPDWSYLQVALNMTSLTEALQPTYASLENFRTRLNDLWDFTGLTSGVWGTDSQNGQPHTTSHYGFHMPFYYLLPGLSGQQSNIPGGGLSFSPPALQTGTPFAFPWFLAGTIGSVAVDAAGTCTFSVSFGSVTLPAGGLSVYGTAYSQPLSLSAGQSVSWSVRAA